MLYAGRRAHVSSTRPRSTKPTPRTLRGARVPVNSITGRVVDA